MTASGFEHLAVGHHRIACPECDWRKHRARDTAMSVTVDSAGGVYLCHRCGAKGGWRHGEASTAIQGRPRRPRSTPSPTRHLTLASHWRDFWHGLERINGVAAEYLLARECAIPPPNGHLRCAPALRHPSGYVGPGIVALVTNAVTGEPMTLHQTWVMPDGTKANVDPPRLLLSRHHKQGGVIRLCPDDSVTMGLAIAEGIETALTLAHVFTPVWSCIDAGNMARLPVLDGVEALLIAADHDRAGLEAAGECARAWHRAGRAVRLVKSPIFGQDLNDYARAA